MYVTLAFSCILDVFPVSPPHQVSSYEVVFIYYELGRNIAMRQKSTKEKEKNLRILPHGRVRR